jgi:glycosyltransferase involved in cell wall biosynthesis
MTLQKDPLTVIRAMKLISEQTKDIVLLMVGEGDLKSEAVALAKNLNLTKETLIFDNFRQDVPDLLHAIDIYCLPSLWEGLPIGLLEAMAMKKVVIASPIDGTKEAIIDGINGIHVPVGKPQKLADAILSIHKNKELQKKLSENAIKTIYKKFTLNEMVKNIENQYKLTLKIR